MIKAILLATVVPFMAQHRNITPSMEVTTNFYGSVTGLVDKAYITNRLGVATFQEKLESGTNIKTINHQDILGSGNINIEGGGGGSADFYDWKTNRTVVAGRFAQSQGDAVALGVDAKAKTNYGIAVGANANASSNCAIAVGLNTLAKNYGMAIGCGAKATNDNSIALGRQAKSHGNGTFNISDYNNLGLNGVYVGDKNMTSLIDHKRDRTDLMVYAENKWVYKVSDGGVTNATTVEIEKAYNASGASPNFVPGLNWWEITSNPIPNVRIMPAYGSADDKEFDTTVADERASPTEYYSFNAKIHAYHPTADMLARTSEVHVAVSGLAATVAGMVKTNAEGRLNFELKNGPSGMDYNGFSLKADDLSGTLALGWDTGLDLIKLNGQYGNIYANIGADGEHFSGTLNVKGNNAALTVNGVNVMTAINGKQATLVSGTNIKTVNGNTLLGDGDVFLHGENLKVASTGSTTIKSELDNTKAIVQTWESFLDGSNVVFSITNYISGTYNLDAAKLRILELRDGTNYVEVYNSRDEINMHIDYFRTNDFTTALNEKADKAWGKYTSDGVDASSIGYSNTVYITAPQTVFAGGMEYERIAVGLGSICVLTDKGAPTYTYGDEGTFKFQDGGGTNYFGFAKSDSYTLGCNTDGISVAENIVTLVYDVTMIGTPCIWYKQSLENNTPWEQLNTPEGQPIPGASKAVAWDTTTPGHIECYINCSEASGFFKATIEVSGAAKFMTNMPADLMRGIICTNTSANKAGVIKPSYNGSTVIWTWSEQ